MSYDSTVLADSPVSFWKCNETGGTTLADSGSNGNTLTLSGGYTLNQTGIGDSEPSILMGGTNGQGQKTSPSGIPNAAPLTVEFWMNAVAWAAAASSLHFITNSGGAGASGGWAAGISNANSTTNSIVMTTPGGVDYISNSNVAGTGAWYYVVIVVPSGGASVNFYVNGSAAGTVSTAFSPGTPVGSMAVGGRQTWSEFFNGSIAKVALYNTALTTTQISTHYAAQNSGGGGGGASFTGYIPQRMPLGV